MGSELLTSDLELSLTLIIPTFNRHKCLARVVEYYAQHGFRSPIIVADSSSGDVANANARLLESYARCLNIELHRFGPATAIIQKCGDAIERARTPYVAFCADDDFVIPSGMSNCLRFLHAHADYSVAQGRDAWFRVANKSHGADRSIAMGMLPVAPSIGGESAEVRLADHLFSYYATFYGVHRRGELLANFRDTHRDPSDLLFLELTPSCMTAIQGKIERLAVPYSIREVHVEQACRIAPPWKQVVLEERFSKRYGSFRDALVQRLCYSEESRGNAQQAVDRAFIPFLISSLSVGQTGVSHASGFWNTVARSRSEFVRQIRRLPLLAECLMSMRARLRGCFELRRGISGPWRHELGKIEGLVLRPVHAPPTAIGLAFRNNGIGSHRRENRRLEDSA